MSKGHNAIVFSGSASTAIAVMGALTKTIIGWRVWGFAAISIISIIVICFSEDK